MKMPVLPTLLLLGTFFLLPCTGEAAGKRDAKDRPREGDTKVGQPAPDFTLKSPDEKTTFKLSEHKGKRPAVLVFGSYT